ncbi:hypothetical protein BDD12DRAFT_780639, partial [Trichophaea hybrida]
MGGFAVDTTKFDPPTERPIPSRMTITFSGLITLARAKEFLEIDCETINDKSKADVLAKGLVIFQVVWMVVQVVARKIKGLPLTLLEIHTLVHVFCALVMYCFWFKKPVRVRDPTMVAESTGNILRSAIGNDTNQQRKIAKLLSPRASNITSVGRQFGPWETLMIFAILFFVIAAYGGIHFLAWSCHFPTEAESHVWKMVCIATVVGSLSAPAWLILRIILYPYWLFSVLMAPFFIFSRVTIVAESFLSLRKVPEGAYVTVVWSEYIPHI